MLIIREKDIIASSGSQTKYLEMLPWQHKSGANWWTCSNADGEFELDDLEDLRKRTELEIIQSQTYKNWLIANPLEVPENSAWNDLQIRFEGLSDVQEVKLDADGCKNIMHNLNSAWYQVTTTINHSKNLNTISLTGGSAFQTIRFQNLNQLFGNNPVLEM